MKSNVFMISIVLFSFLSSKEMVGQNFFKYENYLVKNKVPLKELGSDFREKIRILAKDTIGQKFLYPGTCLNPTSSLYNFFIEKDIISGYVDIYEREKIPKDEHYVSKKEFIEQMKKSLKMYYLGEVIHENTYKSYLFCTYKNDSTSKNKREFLVNLKNGYLQSIVLLSESYLSDFGQKLYTIYLGNSEYIQISKTLYSDVIGVDYQDEKPISFRINSDGFIKFTE